MSITTPQVGLDSLPNIQAPNFDVRVLAQLLSDDLTNALNPISADNNISFIEDYNFVKNSLNIDQFQVLEDIYNTKSGDLDIKQLQELELIYSILDQQGVENLSPYELYAILILLSIMGL